MKKFSILRFLFGLLLVGGIVALCCAVQREDKFSLPHLSDGLFIAAAVVFLYSLEFTHTLLGHQASVHGSYFNAYYRVMANMNTYDRPNRFVIPEYLSAAVLAAAAGGVLLLFR
jgi:hypothetical protein